MEEKKRRKKEKLKKKQKKQVLKDCFTFFTIKWKLFVSSLYIGPFLVTFWSLFNLKFGHFSTIFNKTSSGSSASKITLCKKTKKSRLSEFFSTKSFVVTPKIFPSGWWV